MAKIEYTSVPAKQRRVMIRGLAKFFMEVKSEEEMIQVLHRLLTPSEIVMLGRRLHVADELIRGKSYRKLEEAIPNYDQLRQREHASRSVNSLKLSSRYIHLTWPLGLLDLILNSLDSGRKK